MLSGIIELNVCEIASDIRNREKEFLLSIYQIRHKKGR